MAVGLKLYEGLESPQGTRQTPNAQWPMRIGAQGSWVPTAGYSNAAGAQAKCVIVSELPDWLRSFRFPCQLGASVYVTLALVPDQFVRVCFVVLGACKKASIISFAHMASAVLRSWFCARFARREKLLAAPENNC